ncbi:alpha/beta hydrolase [Oscillochloris sp. ZM17-4]|uniref:alpha/beta fold hydrolase n=1 Tax=Oscillochloris sp. ZM17-4 TaxID=2866714 RepID=UPI001C72ED93|nr:alpha/beta hydrolase [Oscillochloris sp. ZM17-4]MBX0328867.1 alpha/beta hydrolase [Oscillochloris sp. ZM17-4]
MPAITVQGAQIFFRTAGEGPPLLLIPGNTCSSACHAGEIAHFAQRYRVIAPDLPGTGQSARRAAWPHDWWAASAATLIALLDQLSIDRCALVGTSGGAAIALLAAIAAPARIAAVVADSVVAHFPAAALQAQIAARSEETAGQRAFWEGAHGADWRQVIAADTAMLAGHAAAGIDYFGDRLGLVACPTLLTASLADSALPEVGRQIAEMARAIPAAQVALIAEGDHPLMWSRPDRFRAAADPFLAQAWPARYSGGQGG